MTLTRNLKDSNLVLILVFSTLLRLLYWTKYTTVWWDSAVYLSIGRFLSSQGAIGFIEPLRPLALPVLLGLSWKLGMNDILISRLLGLFLSLCLVVTTYLLGKQESKEIAAISSILVSLSVVTFSFTFRNYTEIPAALGIVFAVLFAVRKKPAFSGISAGIAFLFKFPAGIVLLPLLFATKKISNKCKLLLSFVLSTLPYFLFNKMRYGSFLRPLIEGNAIIKEAGIWIFAQPWYFYFIEILKENILHIFAILGIFTLFKKGQRTIPLVFLFIFSYFMTLAHKEARFMILFLPLLAILTARGIKMLFKSTSTTVYVFLISLVVFFIFIPGTFDQYGLTRYHTFLKDIQYTKEVLTMQPIVAVYARGKVTPAYFPVFNTALAEHWISYIKENKNNIDYIFLDTCEGGMLCPPFDVSCENKKEELISTAKTYFSTAYEKESVGCHYYIFQRASKA